MPKLTTDADKDLLGELGVDTAPAKSARRSPKEQRIIAGFEEIARFVETHRRVPAHGETGDIFERLYAVRLDQIRDSEECRELLSPLDSLGLLETDNDASLTVAEDAIDEVLLASLGIDTAPEGDVTQLVHVRSRKEIKEMKAAEEIAQRSPCEDFETFEPIFQNVQRELKTGERKTIKYQDNAEVNTGDLFILDGQKVMVAEMGDPFVGEHGRQDRRLRVIYDNATESDLLLRSLQRALNKDKASRRIATPSDFGPLFSEAEAAGDISTGYIYVLRSKSEHPSIANKRSRIHKIGVTSGAVKSRIANAKKDPTYLLADVEIIRQFKLVDIKRQGLEALLHKFFAHARLEIALKDRFGESVKPREWFLVPIEAIEAAIEKIQAGTLDQFRYELETESLVGL